VVAEIDAATFLVAVAALLALRVDEPKPAPQAAGDGGGRMMAGFRFIRREPVLRSITLALALAMLAFGFTESAVFSVVTTGLHHRPTFTGVLLAAQGTGAVVAGLVAAPILRRMPEGMLTALALSCAAAAVLLLTLPSVVLVFVGVVLAGFVGPWVSVAAITAIQRRTPSGLLGRVAGAFGLSLTAPQVASVGLGAALIAVVDYRVLLFAVAVVAALAVAYLLSRPETRHTTASGTPPGWQAPAAPG
jgi:predicted MFS family arabinose efflux permease